ncbi:hypothetical protein LCGC14_1499530 [marine sediment metagenome]|uniref:Uncharacterized protein n=1 Tax=marine sediment metagenome TaxID=412755 RepID=A0A0F9JQB3_9ZZZZ
MIKQLLVYLESIADSLITIKNYYEEALKAMVKCPKCKGCMKYTLMNNQSFYYCQLCRTYYRRIPGGGLEETDIMGGFIK